MPLEDVRLTLVETVDDLDEFRRWLSRPRAVLSVDTETEGLSWWSDKMRMTQFGDVTAGWAFPSPRWDGPILGDLLRRYDGPMALHNAKFDAHFLKRWGGYQLPWERVHDTKVMASLVAPLGPMSLKPLAAELIDKRLVGAQDLLKAGMHQHKWGWGDIPYDFPPYWQYAALDAVLTAKVAEALWPRVQPYRELYDQEMGLEALLTQIEEHGVRVDLDYCRIAAARHRRDAESVKQRILDTWGLRNPNSGQALAEALLQGGATLTAVTKSGKWQMDEAALKALEHPLAETVLEMRALEKVSSTYLEPFIRFQDDGRIHADVNAVAARTGRMSISRPSLQNLPRTKIARAVFVPTEGNRLLLADFKQIEMRILAHYAGEASMRDAINEGIDLHTFTAQRVYNTATPTKKQRQVAKSSGFALIYGAGPAKFAMTAGIGVQEAIAFLDMHKRAFPGVRPFMERVADKGRNRLILEGEGYVVTWGGRRLPCDADRMYTLVNYLIQGSARDIFGKKMLELSAAGLGEHIVLPIHDELVFDVPADEVEEVRELVSRVMPMNGEMSVDLGVDTEVVDNWGERYE